MSWSFYFEGQSCHVKLYFASFPGHSQALIELQLVQTPLDGTFFLSSSMICSKRIWEDCDENFDRRERPVSALCPRFSLCSCRPNATWLLKVIGSPAWLNLKEVLSKSDPIWPKTGQNKAEILLKQSKALWYRSTKWSTKCIQKLHHPDKLSFYENTHLDSTNTHLRFEDQSYLFKYEYQQINRAEEAV